MDIQQLEDTTGPDFYYSPDFRHILESHKTFLKNYKGTKYTSFEPFYSDKHQGDLFGLLDELGYAKQYHYAIMLLNEYTSPADLKPGTSMLLIPDLQKVDTMVQVFKTQKTTT
jgi:hypothetical protein